MYYFIYIDPLQVFDPPEDFAVLLRNFSDHTVEDFLFYVHILYRSLILRRIWPLLLRNFSEDTAEDVLFYIYIDPLQVSDPPEDLALFISNIIEKVLEDL